MKILLLIGVLTLGFLIISFNSTRTVTIDWEIPQENSTFLTEEVQTADETTSNNDVNLEFSDSVIKQNSNTAEESYQSTDAHIQKIVPKIQTSYTDTEKNTSSEIVSEVIRNIQRIEKTSKRFLNDGYSPNLLTVSRLFRYGYLLDDLSNDFEIDLEEEENSYVVRIIIKKQLNETEVDELKKQIPIRSEDKVIYYEFVHQKQ